MSELTVIRNADVVVAYDAARDGHVYLEGADVAFGDGVIVHVGPGFTGEALEYDGRGRMIMPGLVDVHAHPADEGVAKGVFDDTGTPALYGNALYEFGSLLETDEEGVLACAQMTLSDLALSGVTTVVDLSAPWPGWLGLLEDCGLRVYAGPLFREARWRVEGGSRLRYEWDPATGRSAFEAALKTVDAALAHPSARIGAVVAPSQADTCSTELLRGAHAAARERGIGFTIHAAQMMAEFDEMLARHGTTTVRWLDGVGVLDERTILGHALFLDHHRWSRLPTRDDLPLLAGRGVSVAHCPVTFARSGMTLESLGGYRAAGVNVAMGTDSYPANMLEEMRQALLCARIAAGTVFDVNVGQIFEMATLAGARALGRDDIGRLAVGARADLVAVDLQHPSMVPAHDPLRSLVLCAAERAVRDVWVDGMPVVAGRKMLTIDRAAACSALAAAQQRALAGVNGLDVIAPRALPRG